MSDPLDIHGTAIAVGGRAVLLRGKSGAGKSDLALRCLGVDRGLFASAPPMLVADDRVVITAVGSTIRLAAPATLRGLLEVRGLGIVAVPHVETAVLSLVADLVSPAEVERLPEPLPPADILGVAVPRLLVAPFEASAPLKLLLALACLGHSTDE